MLAAGCVGVLPDGTVAAGELLSTARQAAAERIDDPELVRVEGVEPPHRLESEERTVVVHEDPEPGDGEAPGWTYAFAGEDRLVTVAVRAEGEVVAEAVDRRPAPVDPLGDWSLGSPEAAEAIVEHPKVTEPGEDVVVEWTLTGGDEPVWEVAMHVPDSSGWQEIVVDARDGEVLSVEGCWDASGASAGFSAGNTSGPLTPASDMSVDTDLPHAGWIDVSWALEGGIGEATAELIHNGTVVETFPMSGSEGHGVAYGETGPGHYVARLTTEQGAHDAEVGLSAAWTALDC